MSTVLFVSNSCRGYLCTENRIEPNNVRHIFVSEITAWQKCESGTMIFCGKGHVYVQGRSETDPHLVYFTKCL